MSFLNARALWLLCLSCLLAMGQDRTPGKPSQPHPGSWYQLESWTRLPVIRGPDHMTPCQVQMGVRKGGKPFVAFPDGWIEASSTGTGFAPEHYERVPLPPGMEGFERAGSVMPSEDGGAYWVGPPGFFHFKDGKWSKKMALSAEMEWTARVGKVLPLEDGTLLAVGTTSDLLVQIDVATGKELRRIPYPGGIKAGDLGVEQGVLLPTEDRVLIYFPFAGPCFSYELSSRNLEEWPVPWSVYWGEKGAAIEDRQRIGGQHAAAFSTAALWIPTGRQSALLVGIIAHRDLAPSADRLMQVVEWDGENRRLSRKPLAFEDRKDPYWWLGPSGEWMPLRAWIDLPAKPLAGEPPALAERKVTHD